jgi:cytochrome P450
MYAYLRYVRVFTLCTRIYVMYAYLRVISSRFFFSGLGPKNCLGMRFALLEIKTAITQILSKYNFIKCDKTPLKIRIANSGLSKPLDPIILKLIKRF